MAQVPVGNAMIGRVVDPLGRPLDGKGPIVTDKFRVLEGDAPNVVQRQPVKEPVQTGLKAVDAMIPIGRGQRELIIGDRQTGKTALALDTIINQKGGDRFLYLCGHRPEIIDRGQSRENSRRATALWNIPRSWPPALPTRPRCNLSPLMPDVLWARNFYIPDGMWWSFMMIFPNMLRPIASCRFLLRRPPGREAYPGDIFYLHSRLLERAAKLKDDLGGGSLTALPIIETQAGDVSAYIPTNVISITDGQIFLESDLFFSGIRPAINVGISVSRVGGNAQTKAMKKVAGSLRLDLAQYRELGRLCPVRLRSRRSHAASS